MSQLSVSSINPNFKSATQTRLISVEEHSDYDVKIYETPATTSKKWGVGIASALVNGLGQAINGQWGKAAGFFFGSTLVSAAFGGLGFLVPGGIEKKLPISYILAGIAGLGMTTWGVVDAVKNAKTQTTVVTHKSQNNANNNDTKLQVVA